MFVSKKIPNNAVMPRSSIVLILMFIGSIMSLDDIIVPDCLCSFEDKQKSKSHDTKATCIVKLHC